MQHKAILCGRQVLFGLGILWLAAGTVACHTSAELRDIAEKRPDPRAAFADEMWAAVGELAREEAWTLDLNSAEDRLLTTVWFESEPGLRKKVRLTVVMAPMGVGINANIKYERPDEAQAGMWLPDESAELANRSKAEERVLVERIHAIWRSR